LEKGSAGENRLKEESFGGRLRKGRKEILKGKRGDFEGQTTVRRGNR
jgi:hypothetical protein